MKGATILAVAAYFVVAATTTMAAPGKRPQPISIGFISQQAGPSHAVIGADIRTTADGPGRNGRPRGETSSTVSLVHPASNVPRPVYPTLKSDDPLLRDAAPLGLGSFWYDGAGNIDCIYQAGSSPLCYTITGPGAGTAAPAVDPAGIAAAVVERMQLAPGDLHASPAAPGVTGSDSWFWLDPAPRERVLAATLGGETVTVTATPTVRWEFGDGSEITGGAGVRYQPGTPPPDAIVHVFQTRCLPGDQGRNPYVLASCGDGGYVLRALVVWQIGYSASGPVATSGTLPARTTETSSAYPVSEVRAFLAGSAAP